jgi:tetratricopeptide (TPR) repeat protein
VLDVLQATAPDYKDVAYFLGGAHMSLGQHREAIALFQRALLKYPDYAPTHRLLAHCLQAVGDPARAEEHRATAERLDAANEVTPPKLKSQM